MLHICHARKYRQNVFVRGNPTERPRCNTVFGDSFAQIRRQVFRKFCQTSAQNRLHNENWNAFFRQTVVKIFSIGVHGIDSFCVFPVNVIHLNHRKIPMPFVVIVNKIVKNFDIAVIRKTKIFYSAFFALFQQKIQNAVFDITLFKLFQTAHADSVKVQIINVFRLKFFQRVFVHRD